jgi:hypothetical protein
MIRPKSLRQLAAYSISIPALAVSPKLAKETVYMPSHIAAEMLGRGASVESHDKAPAEALVNRER